MYCIDHGLEALLALAGEEMHREDGYWWKIEVWQVHPSKHIPHGIRYNLAFHKRLHNKHNTRIFALDNAHGIKMPKKGKVSGKRHEYDHQHRHATDKGTPYEFISAFQLLQDFFTGVDNTIASIERSNV